MTRPSIDSICGSKTDPLCLDGVGQKLTQGVGLHEPYFRTPRSVMYDKELSFAARCVYGVLAGRAGAGTIAKIGKRAIADLLGASKVTIGSALAALIERGHIEVHLGATKRPDGGNAAVSYHLRSDVFGTKQRDGITQVGRGPSGGRRIVAAGEDQRKRA